MRSISDKVYLIFQQQLVLSFHQHLGQFWLRQVLCLGSFGLGFWRYSKNVRDIVRFQEGIKKVTFNAR